MRREREGRNRKTNEQKLGKVKKSTFCSSRGQHTRYWRDWSSDVCSSDLLDRPNYWLHLTVAAGLGAMLTVGMIPFMGRMGTADAAPSSTSASTPSFTEDFSKSGSLREDRKSVV